MKRAILLVVLVGAGCVSSRGPAPAGACDPRSAALAGVWRSYRASQAGPSWVTITLRCDCTYTTSVQLLWMRISEEGAFAVRDDAIAFARQSGETVWPYELRDGRLTLSEAPEERHEYRRARTIACR